MTRKDFTLIAKAIRTADEQTRQMETDRAGTLRQVVRELAAALAEGNPSFDIDKFKAACGGQ